MKTLILKFSMLLMAAGLTACSTNFFGQKPETASSTAAASTDNTLANGLPNSMDRGLNTQATVGGGLSHGMDANDRVKMTRALDKPLGKSTEWQNASTGMAYSVVPVSKVTINGNPFCRRYTTTATRGGSTAQEQSGTACVGSDGNWHPLNG